TAAFNEYGSNYLFLLWQKENIPPHDKVLRLVQYS
ncbi:hypothetical protein SeGA_2526, partial [Salmonella enterica subsp. enterica serovar Gaminara str. A4-567]